MKVSLIIAVYNHFNWLRLILDALRMQTVCDFEVVIADDASSEETVNAIREYAAEHNELQIVHSWIPDEGWRKNISLNQAVRKASGDYLIFIDGDCIPHTRFVEDHLALCRKGSVIAGRRADMHQELSDSFSVMTSLPEKYFAYARKEVLKSFGRQPIRQIVSELKRMFRIPLIGNKSFGMKKGGFLGCNFSIFREDLEKVNGFDERYLDPGTGEDSDLDLRLQNAGIFGLKVARNALMLHRKHKRLVFESKRNNNLYETARQEKLTYVPTGLKQK